MDALIPRTFTSRKALSNHAYDFLKPIAPNEPWAIEISLDTNEISLKNICWPGFVSSLRESHFENCFFGTGICGHSLLEMRLSAEPKPIPPPSKKIPRLHHQS
jgi:hypothetical protein